MPREMVFCMLVIFVVLGECVAQMQVYQGPSVQTLSKFVNELLGVRAETKGRHQGRFMHFVKIPLLPHRLFAFH